LSHETINKLFFSLSFFTWNYFKRLYWISS